jgi:hypothetical protein
VTQAPAGGGSGAQLAEHLRRRLTRAAVIANGIGALVTFFAVGFLAPLTISEDETASVTLRNAIAASSYVAVAMVAFIKVGDRRAEPIREWLRSERPAGDAERERVLSQPFFAAGLSAVAWGPARCWERCSTCRSRPGSQRSCW